MSCSYYLRRKPDKEKLKELTELMFGDDTLEHVVEVQKLFDELYGDMWFNSEKNCLDGCGVKIGRYTGGWKFLWHPLVFQRNNFHFERVKTENGEIIRAVYDDPTFYCFWGELTRDAITSVIMDDNNFVYDEYGQLQDKNEFLNMAMNTQGYDDDSYFKEHPEQYRYKDYLRAEMFRKFGCDAHYGKGDFYSDGLRFAVYDF
jgi:hypothetical protein